MAQTRMTRALAYLKQLIAQGYEFPDAVWKVSKKFDLNERAVEILEDCYDEDCCNMVN